MNRITARTLGKWAVGLSMLPLAACAHNPPPPPPMAAAPAPAPMLSSADQNFVQAAGASDAFEVQSSQLAGDKAHRAAIKQYASQMVSAHSQTTQQLMQIVQSKGMPAPTPQLNADQQQMLTSLQADSGAKFDRDYIRDQIMGHQAAVQAFQQEISGGQDADVKAFAQATLPTIQQHLMDAQKLSGMRMKTMRKSRDMNTETDSSGS